MRRAVVAVGVLVLLLAPATTADAAKQRFTLTSTAFEPNGSIPVDYTCKGAGMSPALAWRNVPSGTKEFALIMQDPDTPIGTFVHWVVAGIGAKTRSIPANTEPANAFGGVNGAGRTGWIPPCPPSGVHRYVFTLYALKKKVSLPPGATATTLRDAVKGRTLATATLIGRFGAT
jgi:Raf kinase inhibitor-like YbhB/YbcL family protein